MKQEQSTLPRIPLTAVAAMLSLPAHAALLTLACEGTIKTEVQSGAQIEYPLSQGIVIDWDNRSVKGLSGGVGQIYEMDTQVIRGGSDLARDMKAIPDVCFRHTAKESGIDRIATVRPSASRT
jgi:hypothetical protein